MVVGAILHPGGLTYSPRSSLAEPLSGVTNQGWSHADDDMDGHGGASGEETWGLFVVSGDEKLLRQSN
ncbi:hypothetical protein JVT61DRAFT_7433 [Boletus reticuloceps]|uniref:Uncharacterized protein n=1 Tax=Boletus reticuloceps TaxID=495285 RepID=A0A8I2YK19_9AGAM|nr:hypothetical protein JVT61DRAFT_7433 [Boletus reticuloceps]